METVQGSAELCRFAAYPVPGPRWAGDSTIRTVDLLSEPWKNLPSIAGRVGGWGCILLGRYVMSTVGLDGLVHPARVPERPQGKYER